MAFPRKLLRVDLTKKELREELIPDHVIREFVGGRGLGIWYLYNEVSPGVNPLGPENKIMLLTGPLAGTPAQGTSRWMVVTKSPLTGGYARSVSGSDYGAWLRFAGFDFIIVEGKAEKPVYLYIKDDNFEIYGADVLWGKGTFETQEKLKEKHGSQIRSACIGRAGEKLVRIAGIITEKRAAARCGVGAVMGSKNLKAVVIDATRKIELHDRDMFRELVREQVTSIKNSQTYPMYSGMGTVIPEVMNALGIFPVRNFREGQLDGIEEISSDVYQKVKEKDTACYSCLVHCGNVFKMDTGPYAGVTSEGPDYQTIWSFTGPIDSIDVGATVAADSLCDDLGLDTISTGGVIGFAYELFEKGILTKKDVDNLDLTYGNHASMIELIKKIANREGIGDLLAEGTARAADLIGKGASEFAMHVKGLEIPGYEPRGAKGQGLEYATSNIGASHCMGYTAQEVFGVPVPRSVDRFDDEGKGDIVMFNQDITALQELGIFCLFVAACNGFTVPLFSKMLFAATGVAEFKEEMNLLSIGERVYNLERVFNVREGFDRKNDLLPKRMLKETLRNAGPAEGQVIRKMEKLLDEYYDVRGWNSNGIPTPEKLKRLGLETVIKNIEKFIT